MGVTLKLVQKPEGQVVVENLLLGDNYFSRLKGLMFTAALPPGHAMILIPCSSIHTFFMQFALDLVMIDRHGEILEIRQNIKPWTALVGHPQTYAIIELTAGEAHRFRIGAKLCLQQIDDINALSSKVRFLLETS